MNGDFKKYLIVILLSSVVSALVVLFFMERSGDHEAGGKLQTTTKTMAENRHHSVKCGNKGQRRAVRNLCTVPGSENESDAPNGEEKSNVSKMDTSLYWVSPDDRLIVSNSSKSVQKIYQTRIRDMGSRGNFATRESHDGKSTAQYGAMDGPMEPMKIRDPLNPQPGMIASAYSTKAYSTKERMDASMLQESNSMLPEMPAQKTFIDKGDKFSFNSEDDVDAVAMR